MKRNLTALTTLRFVAALWVVVYHFLERPLLDLAAPWPARAIVGFGDVAVPFFFILSGYVLTYTYTPADLRGQRRAFYVARFARTYPTYVLGLGLALGLSVAAGRGLSDPVGFLLATVGLQSWAPGHAVSWNFPAWTLSVEFFFYAMFPAVLAASQKPRFFWAAYVATVAATLAFTWWWAVNARGSDVVGTDLIRIPPLHLASFATGIVLARARPWTTELLTGQRATLLLCGAAISLMIVALMRYFFNVEAWWTPIEVAVLLPLLAVVVVAAAHLGKTWLDRRFFVELGEASYAVYILQMPILTFVTTALELSPLHPLMRASIAIAILVGVSLAVHRLFEVPARRWIRQTLMSRAAPPARAERGISTKPVIGTS